MGEDVADGKSSRPWAMHGQPPGRPPGPSTEYPSSYPSSCILPIPSLKIDKEWTLYGVWRSFHILKVDPWLILLKGNEGFGGFEADRLRDRILSAVTKRF